MLSGTICSGDGVFVSSIESSSSESLDNDNSSEKKKAERTMVKILLHYPICMHCFDKHFLLIHKYFDILSVGSIIFDT